MIGYDCMKGTNCNFKSDQGRSLQDYETLGILNMQAND